MNNPLQNIKITCQEVVNHSEHVIINENAIKLYCDKLNKNIHNMNHVNIQWDSNNWHFCSDASVMGPLTVQYIFVLDALNFCFWPTKDFEYDTLAISLKNVLDKDNHAFDADRLIEINEEILQSWFPEDNKIPMISERVRRLQEVGYVLKQEFNGFASNLVKAANHSAVKFVQLVLMHFPGFRDTSIYKGCLVHFYKRAQILVGDTWAAYGKLIHNNNNNKINNNNNNNSNNNSSNNNSDNPFSFYDMDKITMFADYRVPQILRHIGILTYSMELAFKIDNYIEIPYGSIEEVEIRANTIIAVDKLHKLLLITNPILLELEVDWLLWQWGESIKDKISPHHRTLTIYY